jgi:EmrB/QacA subfamily drug resistance transporter
MKMMHQPEIDYSRKWYVMAAVSLGVFLATIDGSIVNIAMPSLVQALDTELAIVQWVVLAYLLTVTILLPSIGRIADILGKKPLYIAGFVVFTIGSALCALSPTVTWLIGFRVLQAVGAAMMMGLGAAIITEAFPTSERGRALGMIGLAVSAGIITGPMLGGLLLKTLSWHWIFLVNVPLGILATPVAMRVIPDTPPPGGQRFDFAGAATLFICLMALLMALTLGQQIGFAQPWIVLLFAVWLIFLGVFLLIEKHSPQPMIDLTLFRNSSLSIGLVNGFVTFIIIAGVLFLMPFYLENILGYSEFASGQLLAVFPLALGLTAPLAGWLSDRLGTRSITFVGLLILVLGYLRFVQLDEQATRFDLILLFLPIGIGMGVFQSPNNSAIMGAAPPGQLGVVSGLLAVTRTMGQTTGVAILNAVWAGRVYYYADGVLPGGAPAAPIVFQVAGLQDTFLVAVLLIGLTLLLSAWEWLRPGQRALRQAKT